MTFTEGRGACNTSDFVLVSSCTVLLSTSLFWDRSAFIYLFFLKIKIKIKIYNSKDL